MAGNKASPSEAAGRTRRARGAGWREEDESSERPSPKRRNKPSARATADKSMAVDAEQRTEGMRREICKISLCGFDLAEAEGLCGAANAISRVRVDTVGQMLDPATSHVVMEPLATGQLVPVRACLAALVSERLEP